MLDTRAFLGAVLLVGLTLIPILTQEADQPMVLRISVENTATHVQARAVSRFSALLASRLGPAIQVNFSDSAERFRDSEVVAAMARGDLEMAVPGTWQLDRFVPEIGYLLLPDFYGSTSGLSQEFFASSVGESLIEQIETALGVTIPGLWMDLGPAHIFTTGTPITDTEDLEGLRIRVAGGIANKMRVEAFGADGVIIPFPDLPPRLVDRSVDGVLTTFETVRSARLWEYGIRYAYTDFEYFPQYVPLVSTRFWNRLTSGQQAVFRQTWNEVAATQRIEAREAQRLAREICEQNGVVVFEPGADELGHARRVLFEHREEIIRELGISRQFLTEAMREGQ